MGVPFVKRVWRWRGNALCQRTDLKALGDEVVRMADAVLEEFYAYAGEPSISLRHWPKTFGDSGMMRKAIIRPGLVSVTFRTLNPAQVIALAAQAQLEGIEWGGDIHVPPGDIARATEVGDRTRTAGLTVAAYGSYYRLGQEESLVAFKSIVETALALHAPLIRVWAGTMSPRQVDADTRRRVIEDAQRCAEVAAQAGVKVALEFHRGTLTESAGSALRFVTQVGHPNLRMLWQPIYWLREAEETVTQSNAEDLSRLKPWVENLHVFQWSEEPPTAAETGPATQRWPLEQGGNAWREYLSIVAEPLPDEPEAREHFALLEFVRDDDSHHLLQDAATLRSWLQAL